ncbi:MAG: hypothetical protein KDC95_15910 [Planctomycetes bacterium]|nr:hypothetical protein [Planctomycetota bacterium]
MPIWLEALTTALVATALCAVALRRGIPMNPDGWAYWEGAYGLARGDGYVYGGGAPIEAFPPTFSWILAVAAAWTNGFSGLSLVVVALATTFVAAFGWALFVARAHARIAAPLVDDRDPPVDVSGHDLVAGIRPSWWSRAPLHAFLAAVLPLWNADLRAEQFTRCIVPFLALALLQARGSAEMSGARSAGPEAAHAHDRTIALALTVLLAIGVLVKHSFLAWLPAVVVAAHVCGMSRRRTLVVALAPLGVWWSLRLLMDQGGSHEIQAPQLASFVTRIQEIYVGVGKSIGIEHLGPLLLLGACIWGLQSRARQLVSTALVATIVQLTTLAMLTSMTRIADPLHARFVGSSVIWLSLACALALLDDAERRPQRARWLVHGVTLLLFVVPVVKSVRNSVRGYGPRSERYGPEESFVHLERALFEGTPPLKPPDYPWIRRSSEQRPR